MAISQTIPTFTTTPNRNNPVTFSADTDTYHTELSPFTSAINTWSSQANALAATVNADATTASDAATSASNSANIATGHANFKGDWVAGYETTGYSLGYSVSYTDGFNYVSKLNNNLIEPTTLTNTTEWDFVEAVSPADLALKADKESPSFTGIPKEEVTAGTLTLGANSSIQTYTATGDFTIIDDLVSGESVEYQLTNGGYTPTYPTMTWVSVGQVEPTLNTTDIIKFKKVGAVLQGKHTGIIA